MIFCFLSASTNAQQPKLILPIGHVSVVFFSSFSPNGKKIVTASADNTMKLWDAITGQLLTDLNGHTGKVTTALFSPDGKRIISSSADSTIRVWEMANGKELYRMKELKTGVVSAQFSPDGKKIMGICEDKSIKIWDLSSGELLLTLSGHRQSIIHASFSRDGKKIITNSYDSTAKIWNALNGKQLLSFSESKDYIRAARFSNDGKMLVTTGGKSVKVWNTENGVHLFSLAGHSREVECVEFSPDDKRIVSSSWDQTAKVWDTRKAALLADFTEHKSPVTSARFSPDGTKIITISNDWVLKIWEVSGEIPVTTINNQREIYGIQFSADGKKFVTASADGTAKIFNTNNGKLLADLRGHSEWINKACFIADDKKVITIAMNGNLRFWDATTGNLLTCFNDSAYHTDIEISPDEKWIITSDGSVEFMGTEKSKEVRIWDLQTQKLFTVIKAHTNGIHSIEFSPDRKKIVTSSYDHTAKIWNVASGKMLIDLIGHYDIVYSTHFSPDGKKLATASADNTAIVWDAETGLRLARLEGHTDYVYAAEFDNTGKKTVTVSNDSTVKTWDAGTGRLLSSIQGYYASDLCPQRQKMLIRSRMKKEFLIWDVMNNRQLAKLDGDMNQLTGVFSPDGKKLAGYGYAFKPFIGTYTPGFLRIWDTQSGKLLADLAGHAGGIMSVCFNNDGSRIITSAEDNTIRVWDIAQSRCIYTFFPVDQQDYFVQIPSGYYLTTPVAAKLLHYVTKDLKVITFEQLDVKYNRPDKVLEAIGNTDTALIKSYRKAWEKRIKKLGIDTTAFRDGYSVPEADFLNRDVIVYEQKTDILSLHIKGMDSTYKLDRFNVWINESPVFGQRGITLWKKNSNRIDTTIAVRLSQGENRIETSITNVNGTESYRMPLTVNYNPSAKQKESLKFIGIGIEKFSDANYNLNYSVKDIRDLSMKLKEKYGPSITIDTLFNENVTVSNVKALKQALLKTNENDKVIVAYSGHGMLSKEYDYYLSTYSVNFNKPEEGGLPYDELENLLDSIPARKKLMLIDACHSGEVDKEDLITLNGSSDSLIKGLKPVAYKQEGYLGLKNSFELMQNLFVNVGKSTGATIISAAAGTQFALERNDLKNGVFTYSILEAMRLNATMKISELKMIVGKRVEELTKGLQKPTSRNETVAADWNLW